MVEDTVDYGELCNTVSLVAQQRSYKTLERLCSAVADRLLDEYSADEVWVKAAKPEPPIPLPGDEVSVEGWRQRGGADDAWRRCDCAVRDHLRRRHGRHAGRRRRVGG